MKPVAFDYVRGRSLDDVTSVLAQEGPDAVVLAGGMSLGPMLNMRLVRPSVVVDIGRVDALRAVTPTPDGLRIGATANQADILHDRTVGEEVPLLAMALPHVGHYQTRSRGTIGGSVAHADPSAEIPLCLLTLGGAVELASARRQRIVAAEDFFNAILTTARHPDEVITATLWPRREPRCGCAFAEFAQRHGDFAVAAAACAATLNTDGTIRTLRLGLGGVEDRPVLADTSAASGESASEDVIAEIAGEVAERLNPLEDMTASAEYRRALAANLSRQVLSEALATAQAEAPS